MNLKDFTKHADSDAFKPYSAGLWFTQHIGVITLMASISSGFPLMLPSPLN